jgi:hypothetical protein
MKRFVRPALSAIPRCSNSMHAAESPHQDLKTDELPGAPELISLRRCQNFTPSFRSRFDSGVRWE